MRMPRSEDCQYTKDHEWIHRDGENAVVGITDFAQKELGDIVYVDLGETDRAIDAGEEIGTIESVKAVAEVYAPVSGEIIELNEALADAPDLLNSDPLGEGWLMKIKLGDAVSLDDLMSFEAYQRFLEEEGH